MTSLSEIPSLWDDEMDEMYLKCLNEIDDIEYKNKLTNELKAETKLFFGLQKSNVHDQSKETSEEGYSESDSESDSRSNAGSNDAGSNDAGSDDAGSNDAGSNDAGSDNGESDDAGRSKKNEIELRVKYVVDCPCNSGFPEQCRMRRFLRYESDL